MRTFKSNLTHGSVYSVLVSIYLMHQQAGTLPLPEGWRKVESRSRPGEFVYENVHTEERQAWFPTDAAKEEGMLSVIASNAVMLYIKLCAYCVRPFLDPHIS